jgi:hypothetical protein
MQYEPSGCKNAGKLSSGYTIGGLSSSAQLHIVSYIVTVDESNGIF